ncbi:phenylacetate-CoA ligase protein [Salinisphaera shabanensis E1L3A]|uniref:Phenylacetate-CoA ligase protein n=1 Tax=Salinisphaera shabanensis E1L3A TaxID=1033802 RepID=F7Q3N0_9GAMM|nr:acyl-CoA synthetase [Salinisphaera shabanensis]ERJ18428.1 phenylacetate-CoA ligase protein [Salinisphaera shabanensis E1L3A]
MGESNPFESLPQNAANYAALSPISFLAWSGEVYPERTALIHGELRQSWGETYRRCRQLASALDKRGIGAGDTVAIMAPNIPATYEMHFAPAMVGAVLNALNVRLDAATLAFMLEFGEAKMVFVDRAFAPVMAEAIGQMDNPPTVVDIDDPVYDGNESPIGEIEYEAFVAEGDADFQWQLPEDEWNAISLNFTSGTTGNPKGVVYHHRGAYLNAMTNAMAWDMPTHTVYLWTLPMFHCNGWCFPWTLAAKAGTNVCLRQVAADPIIEAMTEHGVTHYCGAPIVHSMLVNADEQKLAGIEQTVYGLVAGAAPPAAMIEGMERIGFKLTHVYGLTETYGPAALCAKHESWEDVSLDERVRLNGRQGVRYPTQAALTVVDQDTGEIVPHDGETMGELVFAGNIVMKGYLKNPDATDEAFAEGWYHTGDLGYIEPDGYIKIADRAKDVIISGGENISSLEVESVLSRHPAVAASAVVAKPDEKWGETPCAFIELRPGEEATEADIIAYCREHMAKFKCPKTVVFGPLPTTSTGKVQKYELRSQADDLDD